MRIHDDVIAAIATAPGHAGLAVVRVSGGRAMAVADALFQGGVPLAAAAPNTLHHGWALWPASRDGAGQPGFQAPAEPKVLDEVVAAVFRAPRSYTREDVVEFSCHGGRLPAERVLAALLHAGARLARPGEFTLRAFLNGRLDLAQAEAVADLIHAETHAAQELALSQLAGSLSRRLDGLADRLGDALAEVEARVDFAEDVGGIEVPAHVVTAIAAVSADLAALLDGAPYARAVREGLRVVLVGRPNVGKSSLFNALLGEERAIVTPHPGTTRDLVSERIELAGIPVTLVDTAGWRAAGDAVEAIGVGRARAAAEEARVALWVVDRAAPFEDEDRRIAACLAGKRVLVALNKSDRPAVLERAGPEAVLRAVAHDAVEVSATTGLGLGHLRGALGRLLGATDERPALDAAVANPRHVEALERARGSLARATGAAEAGLPGEIVALELREGLSCLGEVTGRTLGEDLLDRIFSRFCVGK
jgi:tRNA modification GTPase